MATIDPSKSTAPPTFTKLRRNLAGETFGRLTVIAFAGRDDRNNIIWSCQCSCGSTTLVSSANLNRGLSSCGCFQRDQTSSANTTHGRARSDEYESWKQMIQRCTSPNNHAYDRYGGRGIKVCDRWLNSFESFLADMGDKPSSECSLDRIDNNGNYEPSNCRWATATEQMRNRSNSIHLTMNGETLPAAEWAEKLGIPLSRIHARIKHGFSVEQTLDPINLKTQTKG